MKATGMVRNIDELGRIVIPKEMRRKMGIQSNDPVEIYVDDDKIILTKYAPSCIFCGSEENLLVHQDKKICTACATQISQQVE